MAKGNSTGDRTNPVPGQLSVAKLGAQGKANLPEAVFAEPFHESLVHEAARADLAARRAGTASTLGRGEVRMTGAKAWRQKGTGRARAGSLAVPHRRGGGVAFGPKPRRYMLKVNRKARRRALRSALSVHADRASIAVLPEGTFSEPKTKQAAELLSKWGAERPTLVVVGAAEADAALSFRNIDGVRVVAGEQVGVADVLGARSLIVSEPALADLERASAAEVRDGALAAAPAGAAGADEGDED